MNKGQYISETILNMSTPITLKLTMANMIIEWWHFKGSGPIRGLDRPPSVSTHLNPN